MLNEKNLSPDRANRGQVSPRSLQQMYWSGLTLIAIVTLIGVGMVLYALDKQVDDSKTIELAGRQQVYCESISQGSLVIWVAPKEVRKEVHQQLAQRLDGWIDGYNALMKLKADQGLGGDQDPEVKRLFEKIAPVREKIIVYTCRFLALPPEAEVQKTPLELRLIHDNSVIFVSLMGQVVDRYVTQSHARLNRVRQVEIGVAVAIFILLALETLLIFRPVLKRIHSDMRRLSAAAEEMRNQAMGDGLTGIANRRRFDEYLESEWQRAVRNNQNISLIMLDIDFFKRFNDTYGHQEGDRVLKASARVFDRAAQRPSDLAARYGGEEFVVMLPDTDLSGATYLAGLIRQGVEALQIPHSNSKVAEVVTVSVGVASAKPDQKSLPDELIKAADAALYRAKQSGRNRVEV